MSILIKGMEMPKDGDSVVIVISNENGIAKAEVDEYCGAVYEAVPVPPHGRLIDADALHYSWVQIVHPGGNVGGYNAVVMSAEIKDAPTIIPADHIVDATEMVEAEEGE